MDPNARWSIIAHVARGRTGGGTPDRSELLLLSWVVVVVVVVVAVVVVVVVVVVGCGCC